MHYAITVSTMGYIICPDALCRHNHHIALRHAPLCHHGHHHTLWPPFPPTSFNCLVTSPTPSWSACCAMPTDANALHHHGQHDALCLLPLMRYAILVSIMHYAISPVPLPAAHLLPSQLAPCSTPPLLMHYAFTVSMMCYAICC